MELLIIIATLILSALFSGSETAFVSANRLKFEVQKRLGRQKIRLVYHLLQDPARFLSTTLIGNNFMIVICSSLMMLFLHEFMNESVIVFLSSFLLLFFGEILPKSITRKIPNRSVKYLASFLRVFEILLYPLIWISQNLAQGIMVLVGQKTGEIKTFFSKEDLLILLKENEGDETFGRDQQKFLERVIRIGALNVRDVMIPRTEMVLVQESEDFSTIRERFFSSGFSRLPVYREDIDDIIGVLFVRDQISSSTLKTIKIRKVPFFPETKRALEALREFRKSKTSMAIVIDEYGGTAGIVTIEDLVEELFGEIRDEHDSAPHLFYRLDNSTLMVNARAEITQLNDLYNLDLPVGDYVTLAGLILHRLGHIPSKGEKVDLPKCRLAILTATPTKIEWVRLSMKKLKSNPAISEDQF